MLLQSICEFPIFYVIILALIVACAFAWLKAMQSSRRRQAKRDALIAQYKREHELRRAFASPTLEQLSGTPPARLIEGLCCYVQTQLEEQENPDAAFADLPEPAQLIYALGYVIQDTRIKLSDFFRRNGQPLTGAAWEAARQLIGGEYAEIFYQQYIAFDEAHEEASLIEGEIEALDERFCAVITERGEALYARAKEYILSQSSIFSVSA